jgi:YD repeat-containing protein
MVCGYRPVEDQTCASTNPVQPGIGSKRFAETDYIGAGAHAFNLVRHYSSRWTDAAAVSGLTSMSPWQGGWRHGYQASLTRLSDGTLRAFRPDGAVVAFTPAAAANTWTAAGRRDTVVAAVSATGQTTSYAYAAAADDSVETYDLAGKLLAIKARNGWITSFAYSDGATPSVIAPRAGLLINVKNQFGRELKFTYDTQGRTTELLPPGAISGQPAGGASSPIRYVYNEQMSLGAGVPAQSQLTSVVWQDGSIKRYHYEDALWPQAVTGITDEAGMRYGTYAYDAQGRVTRSELAGGAERLDFSYASDANGQPTTTVTDYTGAGGAPSTRTYTFNDIRNVRYPVNLTAPCPLCGSTQQANTYDADGQPTKLIAHDGSVTFIAYDANGRETERATFPSNYQTVTTRPALAAASKVVSTQWHATFKLPTQIAEPDKTTANTYDSKGNLGSQSWTATTDGTGAAGFAAVKMGSTYKTEWSYNANSLATTTVTKETAAGATTAVETGRWTAAYSAVGDLTQIVDVKGGNRKATMTKYDVHGRMLNGTTDLGTAIALKYTLRGAIASMDRGGKSLAFTYNAVGNVVKVRTPDGQTIDYIYDATQVLVDVKLNGVSITPQMLADASYPDSPLKTHIALAKQWLALGIESLMSQAYAQAVIIPGPRGVPPPLFDPRTDMLMSPMSDSEKQVRALQEAFARLCECDPKYGYSKPTFSAKSFAHTFWGGHNSPMFGDQSYFAFGTKVGQALADQVVTLAATQPGGVRSVGTRDVYIVNFGADVGMVRDPANLSGPLVPGKYIRMVVERNNCASRWKHNEVVTMYPQLTATQ